jgi:hypothetical protein
MATEVPKIMEEPAPCSTRPASSCAGVAARPQKREASVKMAKPAVKTRLRPNMSAARPIGTSNAAEASRKESETQPMAMASRPSAGAMAGSAIFTADSMNGVENDASTVISSTVFGLTIAIFYNFRRHGLRRRTYAKGRSAGTAACAR